MRFECLLLMEHSTISTDVVHLELSSLCLSHKHFFTVKFFLDILEGLGQSAGLAMTQ